MWRLLLLSLAGELAAFPPSPCPEYFRYVEQNSPLATLTLPVTPSQLPLHLKLKLHIRIALKTKYVGVVVLAEHPTLVLGRVLSGKSTSMNYTVRFPLPDPIPMLTEIILNNQTVCRGEEPNLNTIGGVLTTINLEHKFPAPNYDLQERLKDEPSYFNQHLPKEPRCGEAASQKDQTDSKHNWPWLTAVFLQDDYLLRFHCTGSLITKKHIITAAHCLRNQMNTWESSNFVVYLGLHSLDAYDEPNTGVKQVTGIRIHPEYSPISYVADIAIAVIEEATLSENIRPVCLWNGGLSLSPLVGHLGTVVGWGMDRSTKKLKTQPEVFHLPIVDQVECLRSRKEFLYITSDKTFCAGLRNGTGPCNGESGSGLIILSYNNKNSLAWHLRGLLSLSLLDRKEDTCDLNEYIVFTDVARFSGWINDIVLKS